MEVRSHGTGAASPVLRPAGRIRQRRSFLRGSLGLYLPGAQGSRAWLASPSGLLQRELPRKKVFIRSGVAMGSRTWPMCLCPGNRLNRDVLGCGMWCEPKLENETEQVTESQEV